MYNGCAPVKVKILFVCNVTEVGLGDTTNVRTVLCAPHTDGGLKHAGRRALKNSSLWSFQLEVALLTQRQLSVLKYDYFGTAVPTFCDDELTLLFFTDRPQHEPPMTSHLAYFIAFENPRASHVSSHPQEELLSIIGKYDGLVVRSGVTVDEDLIAAASNMRIVGRAGTGATGAVPLRYDCCCCCCCLGSYVKLMIAWLFWSLLRLLLPLLLLLLLLMPHAAISVCWASLDPPAARQEIVGAIFMFFRTESSSSARLDDRPLCAVCTPRPHPEMRASVPACLPYVF